jgi:phage gp36-like protein
MPYATLADLKARYDVRLIAKYASDTTTPVSVAALPTNPRVMVALQDASGLVRSACVKGRRYSSATLDTLAADTDKGALLRQIVCALAMAALLGGRAAGVDQIDEMVFGYKNAMASLEELRGGALVFDLEGTLDATLPHSSAGPATDAFNRPTNWNPMFGDFEYRRFN